MPTLLLMTGCGDDQAPATSLPEVPSEGAQGGAGGTGTPPDTGEPGEGLLLDDFEDADHVGALDGSHWIVWSDTSGGGGSEVTTPRGATGELQIIGEGFESQHSLQLDFDLDKLDYKYEPYVGLSLALGSPHDFSQFEGIAYTYKGHSHEIRFETTAVKDYDFFAYQLPSQANWTTVYLWIDDFRQGGWGKEVARDFTDVISVSFQVRGKQAQESGSLWLDDLRLVETMPRPTEPDLEIHPVSPPALVQLGDITVDTPLADLARSSLDKGYNITNWLEQGEFESFEYDEAFVKNLADAGFLALRLPIDLDLYVTGEDPLTIDENLWTVLDSFDAWTEKYGLSLTIDYHQYDQSFDPDDASNNALMASLWGAVAAHFASNDRVDLFYELLNEPELSAGVHGGPTQAQWSQISGSFVDAIRAEDADRPIIFGDVRWYDIDNLIKREPLEDDHIIYAFHFYDPFLFTHQGASWAGLSAAHGLPYPYVPERWSEYYRDLGFSELANESWQLSALDYYHVNATRAAMYNRIAQVKKWAITHQVPVICNEFGAYDATSLAEDRVRYYEDLIGIFQELEIPWQIWFMVMDPETGNVDADLARALDLAD